MLERIGWFVVAYACISITVTIIMVVAAKKAFHLGGPIDMARGAFLLVLAVIGFIIWVGKAATGHADGSANDQIKRTVRKTSSWMDGLKEEWDGGKKRLPGPKDRDR